MASLGAAVALGLAFFLLADDGPVVCVFRLTSRLACPGCGLTRSITHLLRGDFGLSFSVHPFGVVLAVEATLAWLIVGVRVHRGLPVGLPQGTERWVLGHVVAMIALWTGRLASGTVPF